MLLNHSVPRFITKLLIIFIIVVFLSFMLWESKRQQENYAAYGIEYTLEGLKSDIEKLHLRFSGDTNTLIKSIEAVLLKPNQALLDLLIMGEQSVVDKWKIEYLNLRLSTTNDYIHIHDSENGPIYIVAGVKLREIRASGEGIVAVLEGVQQPIVEKLKLRYPDKVSASPSTSHGAKDLTVLLLPSSSS